MADEAEASEAEDGTEDEPRKKKLSGKKLVLFIILPVVLLLGGGGAAAFFLLSGGDPQTQAEAGEGEQAEQTAEEGEGSGANKSSGDIVFYDLPDMLVNLNTGGKRSSYLKLKVALELQNKEAVPKVERILPRIVDSFQVYLRELRLEDLKGSAGLVRLKEELLVRLNVATGTTEINDVLFKEMLVQ